MLVELDGEKEEEQEHSVMDSKFGDLVDHTEGYVPGAQVQCKLQEGNFRAIIVDTC